MRIRLTKPHRALIRAMRERDALSKLKVEHRSNGRKIDVAFPRVCLAIEMQGCFWHGCEACYPEPNQIQRGKIRQDQRKARELAASGWVFMPVRECDFRRDPAAVVDSIEELVARLLEAVGG